MQLSLKTVRENNPGGCAQLLSSLDRVDDAPKGWLLSEGHRDRIPSCLHHDLHPLPKRGIAFPQYSRGKCYQYFMTESLSRCCPAACRMVTKALMD